MAVAVYHDLVQIWTIWFREVQTRIILVLNPEVASLATAVQVQVGGKQVLKRRERKTLKRRERKTMEAAQQ